MDTVPTKPHLNLDILIEKDSKSSSFLLHLRIQERSSPSISNLSSVLQHPEVSMYLVEVW